MRDRYLHEKTQLLSNDENCSPINPARFGTSCRWHDSRRAAVLPDSNRSRPRIRSRVQRDSVLGPGRTFSDSGQWQLLSANCFLSTWRDIGRGHVRFCGRQNIQQFRSPSSNSLFHSAGFPRENLSDRNSREAFKERYFGRRAAQFGSRQSWISHL